MTIFACSVIAILAGLLIASYLAWREQTVTIRELTGRPNVVAKIDSQIDIEVENTNDHTAIEVTADEIAFDVPTDLQGTNVVFGSGIVTAPPKWIFNFSTLSSLSPREKSRLTCTARYIGPLSPRDLAACLRHLTVEGFDTETPLTLVFQNIGPPKRMWHAHYRLVYIPSRGAKIEHVATEESNLKGICKSCQYKIKQPRRPAGQTATQSQQ